MIERLKSSSSVADKGCYHAEIATSNYQLSGWCDLHSVCFPLTKRSLTAWLLFFGSSSISSKHYKIVQSV